MKAQSRTDLFVKLIEIERGLILGLKIDRMLLYFLSCGHDDGSKRQVGLSNIFEISRCYPVKHVLKRSYITCIILHANHDDGRLRKHQGMMHLPTPASPTDATR